MLGIGAHGHKFCLNGKSGRALSQSREEAAAQHGFILSQSSEEAGRGKYIADFVCKYSRFDFLVLAARPSNEKPSYFAQLKQELQGMNYRVSVVTVVQDQPERYYRDSARKVLQLLSQ